MYLRIVKVLRTEKVRLPGGSDALTHGVETCSHYTAAEPATDKPGSFFSLLTDRLKTHIFSD
jgi:hypothetical protein